MPEFAPQALDSLRQPLETGEVMVARANAHVRFPARVQLVAAMNPCRCGHGGLGKGHCGKAPRCQRDYQNRVSGPLIDRIDLQIEAPPVTAADLSLPPPAEGTADAARRVAAARALQEARGQLNARLEGEALNAAAGLDESGRALLSRAAEAGHLTARGWTRTLRLARTIATTWRGPRRSGACTWPRLWIYRRSGVAAGGDGVRAAILLVLMLALSAGATAEARTSRVGSHLHKPRLHKIRAPRPHQPRAPKSTYRTVRLRRADGTVMTGYRDESGTYLHKPGGRTIRCQRQTYGAADVDIDCR